MTDFEKACAAIADAVDAKDAEISRLRSCIEALNAEIERLKSDREYIIGWNDGFEHALGETIKLQFPTMLRKMWSGAEVQKWLDDKIAEAKAARSTIKESEG